MCISTASLSNLPLNVVRKELENLANMSRNRKERERNGLMARADYRDVYPGTKESGPKNSLRRGGRGRKGSGYARLVAHAANDYF